MKGIRQHDIRDCAPACLATVLKHYKSCIPLVKIRQKMRVDRNGVSLLAINKVADEYGLQSESFFATFDEFYEEASNDKIELPLVAHTVIAGTLQHYIVIERIRGNRIYVYDPKEGNRKYKSEEFSSIFTGYFATFTPKENFMPSPNDNGPYRKYLKIITTQKSLFAAAIMCSAIMAVLSIMSSLAYQTVIDKYILGGGRTNTMADIPLFSELFATMEQACGTLAQLFIAIIGIYVVQSIIFSLKEIAITFIYRNSSRLLIFKYCKHILKLAAHKRSNQYIQHSHNQRTKPLP